MQLAVKCRLQLVGESHEKRKKGTLDAWRTLLSQFSTLFECYACSSFFGTLGVYEQANSIKLLDSMVVL